MSLTVLLVCLAGGIGAASRLALDGVLRGRIASTYPVATTIINLSGSLLLGLVSGLVAHHTLPPAWQLVAGTGFLGGYTTFSTASFETVRLLEERRFAAAVANGFGTLVLATGCAALGLLLAGLVHP